MEVSLQALSSLAEPTVIMVMIGAAIYGLLVGSIPGLTATMGVALVIPLAFFLPPLPALAGVMTLATMTIFAGDLPGAFLRIPGTPASAAYAEETYLMMKKGDGALALGLCLVTSAIGGVFGAIVLMVGAPSIAPIALTFSAYEKFWIACLGLTAAVVVSKGSWFKGGISLLLGLAIAQVGLDPVSGQARFTFGFDALKAGLSFVPVLIGMFAIPEILRYARQRHEAFQPPQKPVRNILSGVFQKIVEFRKGIAGGTLIGTVVGVIPGAGADIAAYISYAVSRKFSKHPEKFGTGIPDGLVSAGAANNSSVGGSLIPATVFGIPGDSLTAVIIGILFLKGLNPGPMVFVTDAVLITAVFWAFLISNIMLVPFGLAATSVFQHVVRIPKSVLMPIVLMFCIVGSFAVENTVFAVTVMICAGLLAYVMEEHGYPLAPAILGIVIGPMLEENFINSLIRSRGNLVHFVERPVSIVLATLLVLIVLFPIISAILRRIRRSQTSQATA